MVGTCFFGLVEYCTVTDYDFGFLACREDVKLEKSITGYFDEDGFLAEEIFRKDAEKLLQQFEQHALKSK